MSKQSKKDNQNRSPSAMLVEAPVTTEGEVGEPVETVAHETEGRSRRFKEVWLVEDRKNNRSVWTRVGTAFENADGSWNIRLSALPVGTGRLNVRDPLPREQVSA